MCACEVLAYSSSFSEHIRDRRRFLLSEIGWNNFKTNIENNLGSELGNSLNNRYLNDENSCFFQRQLHPIVEVSRTASYDETVCPAAEEVFTGHD